MVQSRASLLAGPSHEPQGRAGVPPAPVGEADDTPARAFALAGQARRLPYISRLGFMVPMHGKKAVSAFHEPTFPSANFCCICNKSLLYRFTVPMRAQKRMRAFHEPTSRPRRRSRPRFAGLSSRTRTSRRTTGSWSQCTAQKSRGLSTYVLSPLAAVVSQTWNLSVSVEIVAGRDNCSSVFGLYSYWLRLGRDDFTERGQPCPRVPSDNDLADMAVRVPLGASSPRYAVSQSYALRGVGAFQFVGPSDTLPNTIRRYSAVWQI